MPPPPTPPVTATLLVSCGDRTGLVAALSEFVFEYGGNILDADQHAEVETGMFFMRLVWDLGAFKLARPQIQSALEMLATRFELAWEVTYSDIRPRVAVFASRSPHCLYDLLLAHQLGELGGDLVAVVSNHDDLRSVAGHFGVRYEHIPVDAADKQRAEVASQRLLDELKVDLVVLARYMQILTPEFVTRWPSRIINIHHSFLPAFVGAKPYHQAFERGVKLIGATSHYVTEQLDDGPIIEQSTSRISHRDELPDLLAKGRELEKAVLSRAVRWHTESRILVYGKKTVIFD